MFFSEAIALIEPKLHQSLEGPLQTVFFYVDRNSKLTTIAGHSFYIGPVGSFYNQVNDTGSWELWYSSAFCLSVSKKHPKNVQMLKRKYIMTNIDTQETDYSVYHCWNSSKIDIMIETAKIDTPNTYIHNRSLSWLRTGALIKSCWVKLDLWAQTPSHSL